MFDKEFLLYVLRSCELSVKDKKIVYLNMTRDIPLTDEVANKLYAIKNINESKERKKANNLFGI